jgi:hypothetical protein
MSFYKEQNKANNSLEEGQDASMTIMNKKDSNKKFKTFG